MKDAGRPAITRADISAKAKEMLDQLETWGGLDVTLTPAPDPMFTGHMIRVACSQNPPWYRKFAGQYVNCRGIGPKRMKRPRTYIQRKVVINTLRRMAAGEFNEHRTTERRLREFIRIEIANDRDRVSNNLNESGDSSFTKGERIPF
jgi:hypothetical protein